jgi:hypothetical protein
MSVSSRTGFRLATTLEHCVKATTRVLVGDHDLVARLELLAQRLGDDVGVLRRGRTEVQLVGADVQPGGQSCLRRVHLLPGGPGRREVVVRLDLGLPVVTAKPFDGLAAGIGAARVLEVRETGEGRLAEGGKLGADEFQVEFGHGRLPRRPVPLGALF